MSLNASQTSGQILVDHPFSIIDEDIVIKLSGLSPSTSVTIAASLIESESRYIAHAHYLTDGNGNVDLTQANSVGGSYTGIEPMGLFWSMLPAPGQKSGLRLMKKDVTKPYDITLTVLAGHADVEAAMREEALLASTVIQRTYMAPGVERVMVRSGRVRGALFIPKGEGPFPGVIDLFGTAGGLVQHRAALLASRGILAFAVAFFAYDDLPPTLFNMQLEYFEEAIAWLGTHPKVKDKNRLGIVGVSKSAEIVLDIGVISPQIKAVVAISGYHYITVYPHLYRGEVRVSVFPDLMRCWEIEGAVCMKDCYGTEGEHFMIPVEQSDAQFLVINGEDDMMVEPVAFEELPKRMKAHGKNNYEVLLYPGTGHLIEPPHSPTCRMSYHRMIDGQILWGGHSKAHAHAQVDAWRRTLEFFRKHLDQPQSKL